MKLLLDQSLTHKTPDTLAAVNAATPAEVEALIKELDKIDP
ncbi:hypothetical protein ACSJII_10250 [Corynebacterium diphtheriae]